MACRRHLRCRTAVPASRADIGRWCACATDHDIPRAITGTVDGSTGTASYHRYPVTAFESARDRFEVTIGPNRFGSHGLHLDIDDDGRRITGEVAFGALDPWPVRPWSPGVMGPYALAPGMECNHGVLSFDHPLDGQLDVDGQTLTFTGGRGYLEKDWGAAFPAGYIWMQSNHFAATGTSFMASIAIVPWMGRAFPGFFAGLLHGPTRSNMEQRIGETMQAGLEIRLVDRRTRSVLAGVGRNAGLEVHGDLDRLLTLQI